MTDQQQAEAYRRLRTALFAHITNLRIGALELENRFQPSNPGQTAIATQTMVACADRLEQILSQCDTPSKPISDS